ASSSRSTWRRGAPRSQEGGAMATVNIFDIEDAILAVLRADPTMSAYLHTIESYQGQLDEELTLPHLFPAAFVMFVGGEYRPLTNVEQEGDLVSSVLLCDATLRGNQAARRGDSGYPGTYRMLLDLRKVLVGQTFGWTDFPPLLLRAEAAVKNT